jgi:hypothetical protein
VELIRERPSRESLSSSVPVANSPAAAESLALRICALGAVASALLRDMLLFLSVGSKIARSHNDKEKERDISLKSWLWAGSHRSRVLDSDMQPEPHRNANPEKGGQSIRQELSETRD